MNLLGPDIIYSGKYFVKKSHDGGLFYFVFQGDGNQTDPGPDLALISSCNHIILSYGTFGMAAAWFNNKGKLMSPVFIHFLKFNLTAS